MTLLCLLSLQGCAFFRTPEDTRILSLSPEENFDETHRLVMEGRYEAAIKRLHKIADNISPDNTYRDDAMFWLGFCYREIGDGYESGLWYRRLTDTWPESPYAPVAGERLRLLKAMP